MSNVILLESNFDCGEKQRKQVGLASIEIERLMRENGINKAELVTAVTTAEGDVFNDLIKITVADQVPNQVDL